MLNFFFKPIQCYASMLNFNVGKLKPSKKSEYLESTTKSLRYFLLQLSGQVIFCVCLSFPDCNMQVVHSNLIAMLSSAKSCKVFGGEGDVALVR